MNYKGNKSLINLYPNIINEFPPHKVFWELCAGSAQITRKKKKAAFTAVVDKDNSLFHGGKGNYPTGVVALNGCVISFLRELQNAGTDHLIYIDPPYRAAEVANVRYYYRHIMSDAEHKAMLYLANKSNCRIAISHYDSSFYDYWLKGWRKKVVKVSYHGHVRSEAIYFNYPVPDKLHQTDFTGENKTKRQQYKRMAVRWANKFKQLPPQVKQLILTEIKKNY